MLEIYMDVKHNKFIEKVSFDEYPLWFGKTFNRISRRMEKYLDKHH